MDVTNSCFTIFADLLWERKRMHHVCQGSKMQYAEKKYVLFPFDCHNFLSHSVTSLQKTFSEISLKKTG